jgi:predicted aspartyl protease
LMLRRKNRENCLARLFVEKLKQDEGARKQNLMDILQKVHEMDANLATKTAEAMLGCEKKIYNRVLRMFLGKEREALPQLQKDVENMATAYRKLVDTAQNTTVVERDDNPKIHAQLRTQIKQITAERDKVQKDLDEAMISMENMLKEYTQMYSGGGKKEGVKHIENELTQLKQKIEKNLVEVDKDEEGEGEIPDLTPSDQNSNKK